MKKVLIVVLFLLIVIYLSNTKEYNISDDMIRFRVIASSNNSRDILIKELVVKELSNILFINSDNINDTRKNIYDNLENIDRRIKILFNKYNYDETFNIKYGINDFPKKKFLGKTYEAGSYESLVIEIGEAKGDNYFCVLYPSLCMIDYNQENKEFRFKILDVIKELF